MKRFWWKLYCLRYTPRRWAIHYLMRLYAKEMTERSTTSSGFTIDNDKVIMNIAVWKK